MKKVYATLIVLVLLICISFSGCNKIISDLIGKSMSRDDSDGIGNSGSSNTEEKKEEKLLSIYPIALIVPLGQHITFEATVKGDKEVTWSSSDTSVATIDENGRLTPVAEGETIITVTLKEDSSITDACGVLVTVDGNIFLWEE